MRGSHCQKRINIWSLSYIGSRHECCEQIRDLTNVRTPYPEHPPPLPTPLYPCLLPLYTGERGTKLHDCWTWSEPLRKHADALETDPAGPGESRALLPNALLPFERA